MGRERERREEHALRLTTANQPERRGASHLRAVRTLSKLLGLFLVFTAGDDDG